MALQNWYKAVVMYKYEGDTERSTVPIFGHARDVTEVVSRLEEKFACGTYAVYDNKFEIVSIEYLGWETF